MNAIYSLRYEIDNLLDGVGDAGIPHCDGVMLKPFHHTYKFLRQMDMAQGNHPLYLLFIDDGHDSRFKRDGNACQIQFFPVGVKNIVAKEQL